MKRLFCLLLLSVSAAFAQQASYDQLLRHWDYDTKAPLAIKQAGVQERDGIKVHDLSYAVPTGDRAASLGPNGGRVTAYLVVPPGKGPFPAVVYGHWCMPGSEKLNRTEFLDEAVALAHSGVIALLPDHVIARPGFVESKEPLNTQQIDVLVQQVINMRRGADLLLARQDVDAKRLAYVGHSCNAEVGGFLSGIDKRFKAVVIMAGGLSDEVSLKSQTYQEYRQKIGPEKFDAFVAKYSWTDPGQYVSHSAGTPKLLQFATDEPFLGPERARQYLPYVSEPKRLRIYYAPHALNAEATRDRLQFLAGHLGVNPPDATRVSAIPLLVQPPWPKPPGATDEKKDERKDK
jgi:dienelactone hydrolase